MPDQNGRKRRPTQRQFADALRLKGGSFAHAAEHLHVARSVVVNAVAKSKKLQAVCAETEATMGDIAEGNVFQALVAGDVLTSRWFLDRRFRDRGYGQSVVTSFNDAQVRAVLLGMSGGDLEKFDAIIATIEGGGA